VGLKSLNSLNLTNVYPNNKKNNNNKKKNNKVKSKPLELRSRVKKDMDIYPISFVKNLASIVTVSKQQKARPGSTAAHKSSTFYWIELKP
jgi:hypothetical protein